MKAHGLVLAGGVPREAATSRRAQVVLPEPNRRLATECTTVWTAEEGLPALAVTVDCGCRSVRDLTVGMSQDAPSMLASLDDAPVAAVGHPHDVPYRVELGSDHGSV